jgi:tRNA-splicing endonuclease subunit Sen34
MSSEIRCYIFENHHGLIFNPDSIRLLREEHRIIGCLTGNLPEYPRQNNELGLPLELSLEECCVLADQQIISLYQILLPLNDNEQDHLQYLAELDSEFQKQKIENGHERINEILVNRHSILQKNLSLLTENNSENDSFIFSLLETNNAWQNCLRTLEEHEKNILLNIIKQRLQQFTFEYMLIKLPLESKRTNLQLRSITTEELKRNLKLIEQLRCDIFSDLYLNKNQKYWISNGEKFGGDYLIYLDDPSRCHSTFIITCILRNEIESNLTMIPLTHLIARCRVAVNVNKTCILASRKSSTSSSEIEYLTINWNGF